MSVKSMANKTSATDKNILLIHITHGFGGAEVHKIALYKLLIEQKYNALLLVAKNSPMEQELQKLDLPYRTTKISIFLPVSILYRWALYYTMYKLCSENLHTIVQCYTEKDSWAAQRIAQSLPIKIVLERHIPTPIRHTKTLLCDAIIGVSKPITIALEKQAHEINSHVIIEWVGPFFNEDTFLQFRSSDNFGNSNNFDNRALFFKKNFNSTLKDLPIITMIAHMNKDITHKNHPLILNALHKLVYEKNKPAQLLLVGHGVGLASLKKLVMTLKLQDYVYFLGFTEQTPAILFYSDMHVLASSKEAFGLVHLEASLMKKPIIAATKTGAVDLIIDGYNGLLFENNNLDSLTTQIEKLLDNTILRSEMGQRAFVHARENFSNNAKFKLVERLYQKIFAQ